MSAHVFRILLRMFPRMFSAMCDDDDDDNDDDDYDEDDYDDDDEDDDDDDDDFHKVFRIFPRICSADLFAI
jgi:ABC-type Zn2+ transport system substrate-binding protein/surface adhesin